jgi:hypothetical protein
MQLVMAGNATYRSWAQALSAITGNRISRQAVFQRMNAALVNTIKSAFESIVKELIGRQKKPKLFEHFNNIWIQDSTTLNLPAILSEKYEGITVKDKKKATAKLNIVVNALSGFCPHMSWSSFMITEQKLSADIMLIAQKYDLVIRDLGYFVLPVFRKMKEEGIYFLSRWRSKVNLYSMQGKYINLRGLLRGKAYVDMTLLCGEKERVEMRFIAIKLPTHIANERRRKAKANSHKNANHDKLYFELLGYAIYITSVGEDIWTYKQVAEAYGVRWQVETLFKSWKSGFCIKDIMPQAVTNQYRIECILYLILLYLTLYQTNVYEKVKDYCFKRSLHISIIQLAKWALANTINWLTTPLTNQILRQMTYYCSYDTRRRINASQRFEAIFIT